MEDRSGGPLEIGCGWVFRNRKKSRDSFWAQKMKRQEKSEQVTFELKDAQVEEQFHPHTFMTMNSHDGKHHNTI